MNPTRREFLSMAAFLGIHTHPITQTLLWANDTKSEPKSSQGPEGENPYLESVYAPVNEERLITDLEVVGKIPNEICGAYFRNGPNPQYPTNPHHWFDGDGMVHRVGIRQGRAEYCNRYVQTAAWKREKYWGKIYPGIIEASKPQFVPGVIANMALLGGPVKDTSNTDLIIFRDQVISLWWLSGVPYALDPETLEPQGIAEFKGYSGNVSAHCRIDPRTGELFFMNFSQIRGWVSVVAIGSDGHYKWSRDFALDFPKIFHDILFTENYVILMDFPVGMKFYPTATVGLFREYASRIILIPRDGKSPEIIFETDPCYVLHGLNAFEVNGTVQISVTKYVDPFLERPQLDTETPYVGTLRMETQSVLWTLDLQDFSRKIQESVYDEENTEFARINDDYLGVQSKYSYHPRVARGGTVKFNGLIKMDWEKCRKSYIELPNGKYSDEFVFIPRASRRSEDDGWVASLIHDVTAGTQSFDIFDAYSFDPQPIASIQIPGRVPAGFHSKWAESSLRLP